MGALASMEDREGETALHKAALCGKLPALSYLLSASQVDVDVVDADGWTPMHNACSKGYLDIVKYLVDTAKASVDLQGGRGGWTPLMNAASNGHLPIVRYLTARCQVDPYTRNASGETAFDVAAAKFEVYICQVLEAYEVQRLPLLNEPSTPRPTYNPLLLHVTVPVIVHQNERLDTRVSTLAVRGGRPRWSGTNAGRPGKADRRAPGTMPAGPLSSSKTREIPMRREDVQLPTRREPYKLRLPHRRTLARPAAVPSHFWLSEWQIDRTHPQVDPIDGWQYAQSFDAPEEAWSAQVPPQLARLLEGKGLGAAFTRALAGQGSSTGVGADDEAFPTDWVRRRRWIRVMRRRLDIEFGDGLEAAEIETAPAGEDRVASAQLSAARQARSELDELPSTASYLDRARALAGREDGEQLTPADMLADPATIPNHIVRLEMAIGELRSSAFGDDDKERQVQAETLLKEYTLRLGQLRQAASSEDDAESEDDDEEGFIYPNSFKDTQSVITRIDGPAPSATETVTGLRPPSRRVADLARASEFRVPTNETPQSHQPFSSRPHTVLQPTSLAPTWEPDVNAPVCRLCSKRFTFFTRKHHCRRCGRIFCAECSAYRAQLSADELVIDPAQPELFLGESMGGLSRICGTCDAERQLPEALRSSTVRGMAAMGSLNLGGGSTASSSATSRASQLNECPVCNTSLALLGDQSAQEMHVQTCLETGGAGGAASVQAGRYLVYRLPAESPILGRECVICLEELDLGQMIARLPCLCFFHRNCIDSWLGRGRSCPTHAR
ncbi:hypothetical protein BCV69DRAFT_251674 [Microstroma glucosiphilum]|uniref:Ankyrin n=1 Tax=Pseudomicrostroma glucosiphilum TaxID=1684307 RepID=A0A316U100_9BASI|nr:hypothetical protein BCV69DRAFT_251674 [Pseudomicrostroma glucosiphilum]PWN18880.1 hypothetical protein BCV69DRAFT_251674 [Pseudomicrostroma glucosiphilum]